MFQLVDLTVLRLLFEIVGASRHDQVVFAILTDWNPDLLCKPILQFHQLFSKHVKFVTPLANSMLFIERVCIDIG